MSTSLYNDNYFYNFQQIKVFYIYLNFYNLRLKLAIFCLLSAGYVLLTTGYFISKKKKYGFTVAE